ncbi:MAG: hypothetical protein QW706_09690 [Candidatus Nezhaarchaeales archaeon]
MRIPEKLYDILRSLLDEDEVDISNVESYKLSTKNHIVKGWVRFKKPLTAEGYNVITFAFYERISEDGKRELTLIEYDFLFG